MQVLDLAANDLGDNGARVLAPCLATLTRLQKLDLNANCIGADGISAIAEHLPQMSSLQVRTRPHGAYALRTWQTLRLPRLAVCAVRSGNCAAGIAQRELRSGRGALSCSCLQVLRLLCNNIGEDGAKLLAKQLSVHTGLQML
jgi:Ran GTPase-activating protein (RanGAP) involved in mRNA processing and transport